MVTKEVHPRGDLAGTRGTLCHYTRRHVIEHPSRFQLAGEFRRGEHLVDLSPSPDPVKRLLCRRERNQP
jgi:hypothetical protein